MKDLLGTKAANISLAISATDDFNPCFISLSIANMGQKTETEAAPGDAIYFMGIIDILQQYDLRKRAEHALKVLYQPADGISAVDPAAYGKRFVRFLAEHSV